jgi:Protein of unknown function (DUF3572)
VLEIETSRDSLRKGKWNHMKSASRGTRQAAEMLAIQALAFIAEDPQRLGRFLDITGIAPEQIRTAARESGFLAGVLEHMLADESLLIAFADSAGVDPAEVARARSALGHHGGGM